MAICTFAENAEEEKDNPDFADHVKVLRKEYDIDGLIYLTDANRIIYFFTTSKPLDEESFLNSFFTRTHPELNAEKIKGLLGNTLLYQGQEAVEYLFRFALNPAHMAFIPKLLNELLERSHEYGISNEDIELAIESIRKKSDALIMAGHDFPKTESAFDRMIEDAVINLSRDCRKRQLTDAMEQVPEKVSGAKAKAITEVFGKEFEALDEKTKALAIRMLDYMEDECKDIPREILDKLTGGR